MAKLCAVLEDGSLEIIGSTLKLYDANWLKSSDGSVKDVVALTRAEYDAIATPDPETMYYITDEV
jgi:hypothetical protein